jgi:acyl-CoA thioester hydrolase
MAQPFRYRLRVRFSECDLQGVVFYPQYLAFLDHAITELWRASVAPYGEMVAIDGVQIVVAEAGLRYHAAARFDEEIDISATITRLGGTSMTTAFELVRVGDGVLLTEAELRHVFVDTERFAKAEIPDRVRAGLERFAA